MRVSRYLWPMLILSLIIGMSGCDYLMTQPGPACEPPNRLVMDIYGNEVCVTPEESMVSELPGEEPSEPVSGEEASEEGTSGEEAVPAEESPALEEPSEVEEQQEEGEEEAGLEGIPRKTVTEGERVSFPNLQATDPDGDEIIYTFEAPLNEEGEWQTQIGDAGEYLTTISASDGENVVVRDLLIVVLPRNNPPEISGVDRETAVDEGDIISFNPVVTDKDGDKVTLTYSGWMDSPSYQTTYNDAGTYEVFITASDGISQSRMTVQVTVNNINRAPKLMSIQDVQVEVGEKVSIKPVASDPDNDTLRFTYSAPLNSRGEWTPQEGDEGEYEIEVTASDGTDTASATFLLTVGTPNLPPVFNKLNDITVQEGETVLIVPIAEDPEGEDVVFTISGWMTSSSYKTTYDDAGTYDVTVTASDGVNSVSQKITVTVEDVNRPPQLNENWWE